MPQVDQFGNTSFNTVFGDHLVTSRSSAVSVHFAWNISASSTTQNLTGTGAISNSNARAKIETGSGVGTAMLRSTDYLRYHPGYGAYAYFTCAFDVPDANVNQRIGVFDELDGLWIGYIGLQFVICRRKNGVDYPQNVSINSLFPKSTNTGTNSVLDTANLNIYQIRFGYLGTAPISFYINSGGCIYELGVLDVTNSSKETSINSPVLPVRMSIERLSGSGTKYMVSGSWNAGVDTLETIDGAKTVFISNSKTASANQLTNVITFKNNTTFNSLPNKITSQLNWLSVSGVGTKSTKFYAILNATLGGSPVYTDINAADSVTSYDIAGTTVTSGTQMLSVFVAPTDSWNGPVELSNVIWHPGDTLTIAAISGSNVDIDVGVRVKELF